MIKHGAQFRDEAGHEARFAFTDAFDTRWPDAFQVPRDELDDMLFRHAGALGADLHERWRVTKIIAGRKTRAFLELGAPSADLVPEKRSRAVTHRLSR